MDDNFSTESEHPDWIPIPAQLQDGLPRQPLTRRQLKHWSLVLQAQQIPFRVEQPALHKDLLVPATDYQRALDELIRYEDENRNWPPPPPADMSLKESSTATLWTLVMLVVFHNIASHNLHLFGSEAINWLGSGNAHAQRILDGEWWRVVTALTLHSGTTHLLGNVAIGGFVMLRLCRMLSSGVAFFLVLAAGIMGNTFNALLQSPDHRSIGASTAIFGAIGLAATFNTLRYRHSMWRRWPVPLAAALGLLAMLGAGGQNTDIGAHLLGFFCGIALALMAAFLTARFDMSTKVNRGCAILCILLVTGAWWMALRAGHF